MAWENANIQMQFLGELTSNGLSTFCTKSNGWYQYNNNISSFRSTYGTVNTSDTDLRYITGNITLLENSVGSIKLIKDGSLIDIYFYVGGTSKYIARVANQTNKWAQYLTVWACIDETNHLGAFIFAYTQQGGSNIYIKVCNESPGGAMYRSADAYNLIKESIIPTYTWQSVPSISGKNGILSLVTLDSESINDGEPVSGADVSVFDQVPSNDNNIKNLADTYGGGEESSAVDVTVKYKVTLPPGGSFSTLKIVAKKDSIPEDVSDGDKIVDISPSKTKKTITGLDENSLYYFKIFGEDTNSNTSESDEKHITTSGDEGYEFDYTGEIQTFVAPKTGIYQLETWGAQGGDATDGTNSARGGYGAYAVGEVFLTQGETIYINVGGQNGYGGGGNYVPTEKTRVLYNNGQYDSRYFGNNVTLDTSVISGSGGFTSCTCTFESDYIGIYGAGTTYWTERLATFLFNDAIIPENTIKIKVSGEYSFSNSYYCATVFNIYDSTNTANKLFNVNDESPTPWTNVQFETEIEKDFDKLKFGFRHDNRGSLSIKIKKIEITYLE